MASAALTSSGLDALRQQALANRERARRVADALTHEQFNWREAPARWSIGECLAHLNVTHDIYLPILRHSAEQARARGMCSSGPFRYGPLETYFVRSIEPPVKFKVKAPKRFVPPPDADRDQVLTEYARRVDDFVALLRSCEGVDLRRAKSPSPVASWIRYSLGKALELTVAHDRRHLWQAEQVRAAMGV